MASDAVERALRDRLKAHVLDNLESRARRDLGEFEHKSSRIPARMLLSLIAEVRETRAADDDAARRIAAGFIAADRERFRKVTERYVRLWKAEAWDEGYNKGASAVWNGEAVNPYRSVEEP